MEEGAPRKKDAVNISIRLWLPERKSFDDPLSPSTTNDNPVNDANGGAIALQNMLSANAISEKETADGEQETNTPVNANSNLCTDTTTNIPSMDPETILAESAALRRDALFPIPVFEASGSTTLSQIKRAVLQQSRVIFEDYLRTSVLMCHVFISSVSILLCELVLGKTCCKSRSLWDTCSRITKLRFAKVLH